MKRMAMAMVMCVPIVCLFLLFSLPTQLRAHQETDKKKEKKKAIQTTVNQDKPKAETESWELKKWDDGKQPDGKQKKEIKTDADEAPLFGKKISVEAALGFGRMNPTALYSRSDAIDALMVQYAAVYGRTASSTGEFKKSKLLIPINITANYQLNEKYYLTVGFDYGGNSSSSSKAFSIPWNGFTETLDYDVSYKVSTFMPRVGAGMKYKRYNFYGALGIGFTSLTHTQDYVQAETGFRQSWNVSYKANGSGIGLVLGGMYHHPLSRTQSGRPVTGFVKVELTVLSASNFSGTRTTVTSVTGGDKYSETLQGTLYKFDSNPLGRGTVESWDLWETSEDNPMLTGGTARNLSKLSVNLTSMRLMLGVRF